MVHKQAQAKIIKNIIGSSLQLPRSMYMYLTRDVCSHSCFSNGGLLRAWYAWSMHNAVKSTGMITKHTHVCKMSPETQRKRSPMLAHTHTYTSYHCPLSTVLCPSSPYPPVCSLPLSLPFFDLVPALKTDICLKREQTTHQHPAHTVFTLSSPS